MGDITQHPAELRQPFNDADALAAKGAMLLRLPHLLGGDAEEAQRLLRHALAVDPHNDTARSYSRDAEARLPESGATAMQRD